MGVGILDSLGDVLSQVGDVALKGFDIFEDIQEAVAGSKSGKKAPLPPPKKPITAPVGTQGNGFEGLGLGALGGVVVLGGALALVVLAARKL